MTIAIAAARTSILGCASILAILLSRAAQADPIGDALNIMNGKNPLAAILQQNHACQLVSPPSPQFTIGGKKVGPGAGGNIMIPTTLKDGVTVDLSSNGQLCPVVHQLPTEITGTPSSIVSTIAYQNDITASLKLTLGSWLKLIDFDASDIQEVGISINSTADDLGNPDLNLAALDVKKSYPSNSCSTTSNPAQVKKAKIVQRSCIGHIAISLVAKKDLTLNAFDFQFAQLTVGLKASWLRDVNGTGKDCSAVGLGSSPPPGNSAPAGNTPSIGGAPSTPATGANPPAAPPNSNGVAVTIPLGSGKVTITPANISLAFPAATAEPAKVVSKPTPTQVSSVSIAPANPASKPQQPAAQDQICATNVIYRTSDLVVLGVNLLDAKPFIDFANQQK